MQNKLSSFLNLPVSIHYKTIEDWINDFLPEVLYEDKETNDDGLLLIARKMGKVDLHIEEGSIHYSIPLDIRVKKLTLLSVVDVTASLRLDLKTDYSFEEIDIIKTHTSIKDYEWIKKPKATMGKVNLSIRRLAGFIIKRSKAKLTQTIDQQLQENFQIRKLLIQAWVWSEQPISLYPPLSTWLLLQPQRLGLLPLKVTGEYLQSQVRVEALPKVYAGHLPAGIKLNDVPPVFEVNEESNAFEITANGEMTLATLEKIGKEQLIGKQFSFVGNDVEIEKISLRGDDLRLTVDLDFKGSYNGWARVSGIPVFNAPAQTLSFDQIQYALDKSNPLVSGLGWLFKRTFEKKLKEALTIDLNAPMKALRQLAQDQLQRLSIHPSLKLQGQISTLNIESAIYKSQNIYLQVQATGFLSVVDQRSTLS